MPPGGRRSAAWRPRRDRCRASGASRAPRSAAHRSAGRARGGSAVRRSMFDPLIAGLCERRVRARRVGRSPRVASARAAGAASGGRREAGAGAGGQTARAAVAQGADARCRVAARLAVSDRDRRGRRDQRRAGHVRAGRGAGHRGGPDVHPRARPGDGERPAPGARQQPAGRRAAARISRSHVRHVAAGRQADAAPTRTLRGCE